MEADNENYPISCQIDSNVRCSPDVLKKFGLCDFHSYTVLACKVVKLTPNSEDVRYMLKLRNPWGTREWKGPWSQFSKTWHKFPYVAEQLEEDMREHTVPETQEEKMEAFDNDGICWMLFKDFFNFFYACTINYTRPDFHHITFAD